MTREQAVQSIAFRRLSEPARPARRPQKRRSSAGQDYNPQTRWNPRFGPTRCDRKARQSHADANILAAAPTATALFVARTQVTMKATSENLFLCLILSQAAHSIEECYFRLYDVLAPARFISSLVSGNLAFGFAIANIVLVSFGLWCYLARVRRHYASWRNWAWFWAVLEAVNGTNHLIWAASSRGYFPGAATAPLLLGFSLGLGVTLARADEPKSR
jgi:hypothetical protein